MTEPEPAIPNSKIVEEFQYLLEKSQQLFSGLRDLPPTGRNWQPYFQRTFELYTKLWKFQQQNRPILENEELYGLKRWEIGEIASKIGQLYYHYYLRTSETNYLFESFVFYEAIRDRDYFKDVLDSKNSALMIKKLRYYARYIVVCLLLNRNDIVRKLMGDLTLLVEEYTKAFKPNDSAEWNVVLSEISTFLEAEKKLSPVDLEGNILNVLSRYQNEKTLKIEKDSTVSRMKLQEAILVGNYQNQIKFSELTLDMYRMLQSLEREPSSPIALKNTNMDGVIPEKAVEETDDSVIPNIKRTNPHKYLLYRPTFAQLNLYIATCFKDISDSSALLLYLSADGAKKDLKGDSGREIGYSGGVSTASSTQRKASEKGEDNCALVHCLHPYDLIPITRKPLFLIVDSTNSESFKNVPKVFSSTFLCLMSATEYPSSIKDMTQVGSLFTLFLHSPVKAFAYISEATEISQDTWVQCIERVEGIEAIILEQLEKSETLDISIQRFMEDDFLRQFIVRFLFCLSLLNHHGSFTETRHFPSISPGLPVEFEKGIPEAIEKIQELVGLVNVGGMYTFNNN